MKLLIVSTAPFIYKDAAVYGYGPYVKELIVWEKYADKIAFCCPVWQQENRLLIEEIPFKIHTHFKLIDFNINSLQNFFKASFYSLYNLVLLFKGMLWADHIHLRCPGNIGLLGCVIQILFPNTPKTAKYAGNWDPYSKQPWSYRLQKWILSNTFLTRNMQVLVYGEWENQSMNIIPFFTATYSESEIELVEKRNFNQQIQFVFVGTLVKGKNPLYAIQLVEQLFKNGYNVCLSLYGEGAERGILEQYISEKDLQSIVFLKGNHTHDVLKKAYQNSHFVILPSVSEGWPKAIAEGMFWGCVPLATKVSCVPTMIGKGLRGILLQENLELDLLEIIKVLQDESHYQKMALKSMRWSQQFTNDKFDTKIKKILIK